MESNPTNTKPKLGPEEVKIDSSYLASGYHPDLENMPSRSVRHDNILPNTSAANDGLAVAPMKHPSAAGFKQPRSKAMLGRAGGGGTKGHNDVEAATE